MTTTASLPKAQKLVERYNRETTLIETLETKLRKLYAKHDETRSAAFAALPEGYGITLNHDAPWEIAGPFEREEN